MTDPAPAIAITGLHIAYGRHVAVHDLDLHVPRGAVFGLIGPNGAGKSSTMRVLATLQRPQLGQVRVCGHDAVRQPRAVRRVIGYMPDAIGVYDDLTAAEYLHFFAAAHAIPTASRPTLVRDVLALTDLSGHADHIVDVLSRGMKQRLQVARCLLNDPELLLLDEPAEGLDPRARAELRELLRELSRLGKTVVISSHILHELAQVCTGAAIIDHGRLVAQGTIAELHARAGAAAQVVVEAVDAGAAALARAGTVPGVTAARAEGAAWRLHLAPGTAPEDVLAALVAGGHRIRRFQAEAADLEAAFLRLTGPPA